MKVQNNIKEMPRQEQAGTKKAQKKVSFFGRLFYNIFGGELFLHRWAGRQVNLLIFSGILAFIYIANTFYTESSIRKIELIHREIQELHLEFTHSQSAVLFESKQTELARKLKNRGLKESVEPVNKIVAPQHQ